MADVVYDAGPAGCGELIMHVFQKVKNMDQGQTLQVISDDPGAKEDLPAWCRIQGHQLLETQQIEGQIHYWIKIRSK